jgi:hypothetical protein
MADWDNGQPYMVDNNGEFCFDAAGVECTVAESIEGIDRKFGQPHYNSEKAWKRMETNEYEPITGKSAEEFNSFWDSRHT